MKALLPKLAQRLQEFSEKASQLEVPPFKNTTVVRDRDALITVTRLVLAARWRVVPRERSNCNGGRYVV